MVDDENKFQCSSASRKFLNPMATNSGLVLRGSFSALQRAENSSIRARLDLPQFVEDGFSALQRAENSSIVRRLPDGRAAYRFQCSSASRKFLNRRRLRCLIPRTVLFQCSSASRKFLNLSAPAPGIHMHSFSALQRAENSSIL